MPSKLLSFDRRAFSKGGVVVVAVAIAVVLVAIMFAVSPQAGISQTPRAAEKTFTLIQQEWGFNQTKGGPSITVNKGDRVILQVKNMGQFPHDIAVADGAGNVVWNAKSRENQQPASSARIEFTARDVGSYRLLCTIPGHSQLGMEAKLVVQS